MLLGTQFIDIVFHRILNPRPSWINGILLLSNVKFNEGQNRLFSRYLISVRFRCQHIEVNMRVRFYWARGPNIFSWFVPWIKEKPTALSVIFSQRSTIRIVSILAGKNHRVKRIFELKLDQDRSIKIPTFSSHRLNISFRNNRNSIRKNNIDIFVWIEKKSFSIKTIFVQLFREIDQNGKGFLDREDLKVASIRLFGCKMEKVK